jgi:hypothetical protein
MKKLQYILLVVFCICFYTSSAQKAKPAERDKRVLAIRDSVVRKLINEGEFDRVRKALFQYYGSIYIKKELEFFEDDILLVQFGTRSYNSKRYWGLIKKNANLLFQYTAGNNNSNLELLKYLDKYKPTTRDAVLDYLKIYTKSNTSH